MISTKMTLENYKLTTKDQAMRPIRGLKENKASEDGYPQRL